MIRLVLLSALGATALFVFAPEAQAHGGRTDASGCHRDRSSGGRHCHNAGSTSQSVIGSLSGSSSKKKRSKRKKRRR